MTPIRPDTIDETMHERLINWSEWVIVRRNYGHCGSIEYRYVPERISDPDERRKEQIRIRIDVNDAQQLERTIAASLFPKRHRIVLKAYYVHRLRKREICIKLGMRFADFSRFIGEAAIILTNRLTRKS